MMPIGPLMIEHRLIERMLRVMDRKLREMETSREVDARFVDTAVDFLRTYADRCHHGKEEDILFRELAKKPLTPALKRTMDELVAEHVYARKTVGAMLAAKERYVHGEHDALSEVMIQLRELIAFYPVHIAKEDKHFFIPCMDVFSKEEQEAMLQEGYEFDRKLIHEKYRKVVEQLGG